MRFFWKPRGEAPDGEELAAMERLGGEVELDRALSEESQETLSRLVRSLADDEPSMLWRGQLDARLAQAQKSQARRTSIRRVWMPVAGMGLAATLVLALLGPWRSFSDLSNESVTVSSIEAELLEAHRETVMARVVSGRGLLAAESRRTDSDDWAPYPWEQADLGAL